MGEEAGTHSCLNSHEEVWLPYLPLLPLWRPQKPCGDTSG